MKTNIMPFTNANRYLFIHVPKTGGTSVGSIIADSLNNTNQIRSLSEQSPLSHFDTALNGTMKFVDGHIPYSFFRGYNFDKKVTVIRQPIDIIASIISFRKKTGYLSGLTDFSMSEKKPFYEFYRLYFSSTFDVERFRFEKNCDFDINYRKYIDDCDIDETLKNLSSFDYIINFDDFESGLKNLIISEGLFPFESFERKRSYTYSPNLSEAKEWLSEFDQLFYEKGLKLCGEKNSQIQIDYTSYREKYALWNGLSLSPFQSLRLNLSNAIGRGWHEPEVSEVGEIFRWSSDNKSTIELPISVCGSYQFHIYLIVKDECNISCIPSVSNGIVNVNDLNKKIFSNMVVFSINVKLMKSGWVQLDLNNDLLIDYLAVKKDDNPDDRKIGFILAGILVRRLIL